MTKDHLALPTSPYSPYGIASLSSGSSCSSDRLDRLYNSDHLRAALTRKHRHLCLAMVGLPGRGKSYIARKLEVFMKWKDGGHQVRLFNVGKYRRTIGDSSSAAFFDPHNTSAIQQRQHAADDAMKDMLRFFEAGGEVGIFDATNSTSERRQWIVEQCRGKRIAVVFIESICDDPEVLQENFMNKVKHSPDFAGMDPETAMADLRARIQNYEQVYETIDDDSQAYIKLYNLQTKVLCNRAYGRLTKALLPFLLSIHIAPRPIWLCRSGLPDGEDREEDHNPSAECRIAPLSEAGQQFAQALADFTRRRLAMYRMTIESANAPAREESGSSRLLKRRVTRSDGQVNWAASCKVMVSALPRAAETCALMEENGVIEVESYAQLNPLDKGMFEDLTLKEIRENAPDWYEEFQRDRIRTRFPGGESYADLINRLEPCVIEAEQQTAPVLICSHTSVLQAFYAYYRQVPLEQAMNIRIEPHTVYELAPLMGGMWNVAVFKLCTNRAPKPFLREVHTMPASPISSTSAWNILPSSMTTPGSPASLTIETPPPPA